MYTIAAGLTLPILHLVVSVGKRVDRRRRRELMCQTQKLRHRVVSVACDPTVRVGHRSSTTKRVVGERGYLPFVVRDRRQPVQRVVRVRRPTSRVDHRSTVAVEIVGVDGIKIVRPEGTTQQALGNSSDTPIPLETAAVEAKVLSFPSATIAR